MSKVLVDREDLEAVHNFLAHGGQAVAVLRWAENILAQPAEAEGVEVVGVIDEDDEGCFVELMHDRTFRLGEKLVRQSDHLAALSAGTAEVEELRVLLSKSLPIVEAHAGASHMLEGFRPKRNKWDELVDGIRTALTAKDADKIKN